MLLHYLKDEEDSFFCLIHVLKVHDWRGCYAPETPKLIQFLEFLDCVLESAYTEIYKHIMDEIEISISPAFISNIQTIFIRDCPHKVATQIFEVFLLDGQQVIFTLLMNMIRLKE